MGTITRRTDDAWQSRLPGQGPPSVREIMGRETAPTRRFCGRCIRMYSAERLPACACQTCVRSAAWRRQGR
jgi:hypothetical protein